MRAYAIDEFGATGSVRDFPEPTPGEGQVRVRVEAASVNPADVSMLGGMFRTFMEHVFPLVAGTDLGGVVDLVGPGVDGLARGDVVFGVHGKRLAGAGTFAEQVVASAGTLAIRPPSVDAPFGAALSLAGASALQMVDSVGVQAGDVVLVLGATGGIGSVVLQLIRAAGAHSIAVTRAVNHAYARELGADETVDYERHDVFEAVRSTQPEAIASIFDLVGNKDVNLRLAELVRPGGHVASMLRAADAEALGARGITALNISTQATTDRLDRLAAMATAGTLQRPAIRTFALADTGQALAEVAGHHVRGKLVVLP